MNRFELSPELARNQVLAPVVQGTEQVISTVLAEDAPRTDAEWAYQQDEYGRRELVLRLWSGDRQAEESFRPAELAGNGVIKDRIGRMKDALAHNGEWRAAVHSLMRNVDTWSNDLPDVKVVHEAVQLNEQRIGMYKLPSRVVRSEGAIMWIEPVAEWVLPPTAIEKTASDRLMGQVDMRGAGGPIRLYYLHPKGTWLFRGTHLNPGSNPDVWYDLDREVFLKLARLCLHG